MLSGKKKRVARRAGYARRGERSDTSETWVQDLDYVNIGYLFGLGKGVS